MGLVVEWTQLSLNQCLADPNEHEPFCWEFVMLFPLSMMGVCPDSVLKQCGIKDIGKNTEAAMNDADILRIKKAEIAVQQGQQKVGKD
ncbi:hypothetical protein J6590_038372 [Homalodisca vitripennis]|nr:hypothetical protein J6590_038372 [Homalodisca vitripennis]